MGSKLLVAVLFLIQLAHSYAITDTIISNPEDERINDIVEFSGFYILSGSIKNGDYWGSYIIKIGKNGIIIKDTIFDYVSTAQSVFRINDDIVLFRAKFADSSNPAHFVYTRMDTSLNVILEKTLRIPPNLSPSRYNVILKSDSTFFIGGSTIVVSTYPPPYHNIFLYLVSNTGDSLHSLFLNGTPDPMRICYDVAEKDDNNYAFISHFTPMNSEGAYIISDNNLNIIDTVNIPYELYDNYSPKLILDSIFVICTRKSNSHDIYISKIKETGQIIKTKSFGKNNSITWPSYQNSLAISHNCIYFLVNADFAPASPFVGMGLPSSLMIGKLDFDLNPKWVLNYGKGYYYHAYNIKATTDGGCILVGTANDTINHNYNRNIFIIKLDSNGGTTWIRSITIPEPTVNVFPNPVSDILNISIDANNDPIKEISIFNIQGKEIQQKQVNACQTKLNVSSLAKGIYIVNGTTLSGAFFRSKFLKE